MLKRGGRTIFDAVSSSLQSKCSSRQHAQAAACAALRTPSTRSIREGQMARDGPLQGKSSSEHMHHHQVPDEK